MYTMKESVAVAKEADAKKGVSPTNSIIPRVRDEPEMPLGSLRSVIGNITRNSGTPSVENIATELSNMHTAQRAPVLLALQKTHGNRYVQRVVAGIQAKLVVGQPGDIYEQEADRVADAVMRMPEPLVQRQVEPEEEEELIQIKPLAEEITPLAQRQVEKEEEEILQTKRGEDVTLEVTQDLESQIQAIQGGGRPLTESDRAFFEPRFGHDFNQVRVHTGAQAAKSARVVNAQAFTIGQNIMFGERQYAPDTAKGQKLLAHELTHVVQQNPSHRKQNATAPQMGIMRKLPSNIIARDYARFQRTFNNWDLECNYELMALVAYGVLQVDEQTPTGLRMTEILGLPQGSLQNPREFFPFWVFPFSSQFLIDEQTPVPQLFTAITNAVIPLGHNLTEQLAERSEETPPPSAPTPLHVAGCADPDPSYKIIRIAWTLDDGPTVFTEGMRQILGERGGTWFIMRGLLGEGDVLQRRLQNLVELQERQHNEIAIHSMHPTQDHGAWFPVRVSQGVPHVYDSTAQAMQDLTDFVGLLRGAGLTIHFVRLPGGLISEVLAYLESVGVQGSQRRSIADRIIQGEDVTGDAPDARPVQEDYQTLQSTLSTLGLHLWGGGGAGTPLTQEQSWEAESSGRGLTDDVTDRFTGLVNAFGSVHRSRSLIVLAHDNTQVDVVEVGRDVLAMETYADRHGVRVEYYGLSDLFRVVRGEEP
jgi:hypothetical protein